MTLNELTYELLMLLRNNKLTDDENLDSRLLERWIVTQRALWLKRQASNRAFKPQQLIQDLGCVEIEIADPADCCNITSKCSAIRTTVEIPRTIITHDGDGITRVGPIDRLQDDYMYVPYNRSGWAGRGYFNASAIVSFRLDDYIYVVSRSDDDYFKYLEYISIRGLFENPRDVEVFNRCTGGSCFSADAEYPIGEDIWVFMKDQIVKGNFGILSNALTDRTNDSTASEVEK